MGLKELREMIIESKPVPWHMWGDERPMMPPKPKKKKEEKVKPVPVNYFKDELFEI